MDADVADRKDEMDGPRERCHGAGCGKISITLCVRSGGVMAAVYTLLDSVSCCLLLGFRGREKLPTLPASERRSDCDSLGDITRVISGKASPADEGFEIR